MIKLIKGDCLIEMQNIANDSIDCIICDLPYGTTACKWDSIIDLGLLWLQYERIIKENGAIVLTASQPFTTKLISSNYEMFKYCWVWNKKQTGNPFLAKKQPLKIHEDIVVFGGNMYLPQKTKGKLRQKGGAKNGRLLFKENASIEPKTINDEYYPTSIIEINNCSNRAERQHPTQKPLELMEYLIKTYTNENDTILDNTMGSGTTGVACKNLNRNFIGIELDDNYFNIAKKRINETRVQTKLF